MTNGLNTNIQYYKGVPIQQITRADYKGKNARRFTLNSTNQNVWIPCIYLEQDGTLKPNCNIDFVFFKSRRKFEIAGLLDVYKQHFSRPNH